ncbi:MAG: hypothetical protein WC242_02615 [Candidatus Paceibacterota bacterium]|jgi:hypothetical protein
MKNIHANLEFLPAPTTVCNWEDEILRIIRSAKKSLKIYWREGFWYFQFGHPQTQHTLQETHRESGVTIEMVVGPLWLSVEEYEKSDKSKRLSNLAGNGIARVYLLREREQHKRFIIVDDHLVFFFEDPEPPHLPYIQDSLNSEACSDRILEFFNARTEGLEPCPDPQEHLLIVEAFEFDWLLRQGLLDREPEEMKRLLKLEEHRQKRTRQEMADQFAEIRDRFLQHSPARE